MALATGMIDDYEFVVLPGCGQGDVVRRALEACRPAPREPQNWLGAWPRYEREGSIGAPGSGKYGTPGSESGTPEIPWRPRCREEGGSPSEHAPRTPRSSSRGAVGRVMRRRPSSGRGRRTKMASRRRTPPSRYEPYHATGRPLTCPRWAGFELHARWNRERRSRRRKIPPSEAPANIVPTVGPSHNWLCEGFLPWTVELGSPRRNAAAGHDPVPPLRRGDGIPTAGLLSRRFPSSRKTRRHTREDATFGPTIQ